MLGLYLYTLILGHKSCNMLNLFIKLTLQKELQSFVTNNVLWTKNNNTTTTTKMKHKNLLEPGIEPETSCTPSRCLTPAPQSQLKLLVVKLFNCFDAMGWNINKQSRICRPHIFHQIYFFCNIFTCMAIYIWQFLIFTGEGLLKYGKNLRYKTKQFWPKRYRHSIFKKYYTFEMK